MRIPIDNLKVWVVQCRPKDNKAAGWRTCQVFSTEEIELFNDEQAARDYAVDLAKENNKFGYRAVSYGIKRMLGPIREDY